MHRWRLIAAALVLAAMLEAGVFERFEQFEDSPGGGRTMTATVVGSGTCAGNNRCVYKLKAPEGVVKYIGSTKRLNKGDTVQLEVRPANPAACASQDCAGSRVNGRAVPISEEFEYIPAEVTSVSRDSIDVKYTYKDKEYTKQINKLIHSMHSPVIADDGSVQWSFSGGAVPNARMQGKEVVLRVYEGYPGRLAYPEVSLLGQAEYVRTFK